SSFRGWRASEAGRLQRLKASETGNIRTSENVPELGLSEPILYSRTKSNSVRRK
ncbi:hypothetical protein A2U01_0097139, partial [Trifolium medium]|nr:hypothetical protein [Trifolium medium]